jgi:hypothetical protein
MSESSDNNSFTTVNIGDNNDSNDSNNKDNNVPTNNTSTKNDTSNNDNDGTSTNNANNDNNGTNSHNSSFHIMKVGPSKVAPTNASSVPLTRKISLTALFTSSGSPTPGTPPNVPLFVRTNSIVNLLDPKKNAITRSSSMVKKPKFKDVLVSCVLLISSLVVVGAGSVVPFTPFAFLQTMDTLNILGPVLNYIMEAVTVVCKWLVCVCLFVK